MFANVLRSQARLASALFRARVSAFPAPRVASAIPSLPTLSVSRTISTSRPAWNNWGQERQPAAPNNTVFAGNLPFNISEDELRQAFESFGPISEIRIGYQPDGRSRGFAHIVFENLDDAVGLVTSTKEEPMYLLDRDLRIDYGAAVRSRDAREPSNALYFHAFPGTEEELRDIVSEFESSIVSLRFLRNRDTGAETGSGFVNFNSVERATEALAALNGRSLNGDDTLRLRYASPPKENRAPRSGGNSNRGGRDRDYQRGSPRY